MILRQIALVRGGLIRTPDHRSPLTVCSLQVDRPAPDTTPDELTPALAQLPEETRAVLVRRYGQDAEGPLSQAVAGQALGLSAGQVRRIERDGLGLLRELMRVK